MAKPTLTAVPARTEFNKSFPELFRYEAFEDDAPLPQAAKALRKLVRLQVLALRSILRAVDGKEDYLIGDDELLLELTTAVECASLAVEGKAGGA